MAAPETLIKGTVSSTTTQNVLVSGSVVAFAVNVLFMWLRQQLPDSPFFTSDIELWTMTFLTSTVTPFVSRVLSKIRG